MSSDIGSRMIDLLINQQNYSGAIQSKGYKGMRGKANILVKKLWQTKVMHRFIAIPIKLLIALFTEIEK